MKWNAPAIGGAAPGVRQAAKLAATFHRGNSPQEFGYCVFGSVIEGMDVVDKIKAVDTHNQGPFKDLPVKPIEITEVKKVPA